MKNKTVKLKGKRKKSKAVITPQPEYIVEYRKGTKWNQSADSTYRYMSCKLCGHMTVVCEDTTAVTCHHCVNEMVEGPAFSTRRVSSGRPAGWHFMAEYVDKDGNVFHKGIEQPDLKGTKEPSVIDKKEKISKNERNNIINEANIKVHKLKKTLAKAKLKKDIKRIKREIAKNTKLAKGKIPRSMRYKQKDLDKS